MFVKILPDEVVSRIAAGEVVERPSSVVKELLENSLDAGATRVEVVVEGGGVDLLRVADDGEGILAAEVEMAFLRHATSKLNCLDDLDNLSSLGFRGEALPSIAAVSEVEVLTRAACEQSGSYICLNGGKVGCHESRARSCGTTIAVRHLFRHFPARLKFLKAVHTENSHIAHVVSQYALAFPETKFNLHIDNRSSLQTEGSGSLRETVSCVYGLAAARRMLEVSETGTSFSVSGLVGPPSLFRSDRTCLSFFVNRRWVRSPMLAQAVEKAYSGSLMTGKHPYAMLNIFLPPGEIDVNIHPAKTEIKFHRERDVFAMVKKAVGEALNRAPLYQTGHETVTTFLPLSDDSHAQFVSEHASHAYATLPLPDVGLPVLRIMGQLSGTYIVAEGPDGLYLIDQHAAHERIVYEDIMARWSRREMEAQGLLEPLTLELNPGEEEGLKEQKDAFSRLGFDIEPFGSRTYLVRAVPALLWETDVQEVTRSLIGGIAEQGGVLPQEEKLAQVLACHGAIRAGQQLGEPEMRELVRQLERCHQPRTCPHGRPTVIHLDSHYLEKEFGRLG